jgi:hypothetical protein
VAERTIEHNMLDTLANKQALADGVLDRRGDLSAIPLRGGRQAFLRRLHQLVGEVPTRTLAADQPPSGPDSPAAKPSDRPRAFAEEASRQLGASLISCDERFPHEGTHSVLYVVVESQTPLHRPRLERLHAEFCGDLESVAPVRLEIVDRATHETVERLIAAGLLAPVTRAARPLHPGAEAPLPLSAEERARAQTQRERAVRKHKMARLLANGGAGGRSAGAVAGGRAGTGQVAGDRGAPARTGRLGGSSEAPARCRLGSARHHRPRVRHPV